MTTKALVLDLGCGNGDIRPELMSITPLSSEVLGIDIDYDCIENARKRFPDRRFECGRGESLPYADATFDSVISNVAVPLMDIPKALAEVYRVLKPDGTIRFSVHPLSFTLKHLRSHRRLKPILYRMFVIANGCWFFLSGKLMHVAGRYESFQSKRGMRIALRQAGFTDIQFSRPRPYRFLVDARKDERHAATLIRGRGESESTESRASELPVVRQ